MKKVTVDLPQGKWGTVKTKYPKDSMDVKFNEFTGTSKNFDTDITGAITKSLGGTNYNASLLTGAIADQYEAIFNDGTHHLLVMDAGTLKYSAGGGIFNTVTSSYTPNGNMEFAMYQNRAYFGNGIDNPQSYDTTTSYGGVSYTAPKTKQMGCIVPSSAPTAALVVDSTTSQVPAGAHTYKVTYLYYGSEESNGSVASSVVTTDATHTQVTVTIPVGGYGVTARKIYRDNNDGNWLLVGTQSDNTSTTFGDKASTGLTFIPVDNGLPPTFSKIIQYLDRLWVAGVSSSGSTLYFSAPGAPDVFNSTGFILCNPRDPIVGLVVFQDRIIVLNRQSIGQILGRDTTTFRYSEIPSSIGCVDNRSIQLRTISGLTTLLWLSDKGVYEFDGNSFDYVSDPIEDQVNFNIQQAAQVKGKNAQDTFSDFSAGTSTPGIVLTTSGFITQNNPKKSFQVEADYTPGTSTNVALHNTGNTLQNTIGATFVVGSGAFNNTQQSGSNIVLATTTPYTGESIGDGGIVTTVQSPGTNFGTRGIAQPFVPSRSGVMSSFSVKFNPGNSVVSGYLGQVWQDNGGGTPGSILYSQAFSPTGNVDASYTFNPNIHLTAGTKYYFGFVGNFSSTGGIGQAVHQGSGAWSGGATQGYLNLSGGNGSTWTSLNISSVFSNVVVVSDLVANSGTWISATYDTQSDSSAPSSFMQSGSYPSGTGGGTSFLEGSNDQATWDVSTSITNANGTTSESLSNRRYWRVRCILTTSDNTLTPTMGTPSIVFPTSSNWISPVIDHTTDITALNSLTYSSNVPSGTSVTVQIATSADNVTYSSYVAVGSAVAQRYSKIKVSMTSDAGNATTPTVNGIILTWTVVSSQTSGAIDTSNTPVGWELFQDTVGNAGTITFQVRTATTSGGLAAASYVTVTNGAFIPATIARFIQWKATLTSTADNIAFVDSVTINWFIKIVNSIRVASVFYNRAYYLVAAEFGQTTNNIGFKFDELDLWRVRRGENIGTLSLFFNEPYAGLSTSGQIIKWLTGLTFAGINISLDVQTAGINYGDEEHNKILRKVYIQGKNTGATYTPQYSVDNGLTWKGMVNPVDGASTFTTTSDGGLFTKRVSPVFATDNATGRTHVFRLLNSDAFACEVHAIKLEAWIRMGEPING